MFGIDVLRLLVTVADTGSFTRAAARLDYTQSAVSRRIAALEKQAGGPLFERLARGVRLTPAGQALHRHAVEVLAQLASAEHEMAAIHAGLGGRLRVGAFATANISLVPAALRAFVRSRPDVEVVAAEGRSGELMRRLAEGALDLAVVSDYPSGLPSVDAVTTGCCWRTSCSSCSLATTAWPDPGRSICVNCATRPGSRTCPSTGP